MAYTRGNYYLTGAVCKEQCTFELRLDCSRHSLHTLRQADQLIYFYNPSPNSSLEGKNE